MAIASMRIVSVVHSMKEVFTQNGKVCWTSERLPCVFTDNLLGWHLPGFDDSKWARGKPTEGISDAGVAFYR